MKQASALSKAQVMELGNELRREFKKLEGVIQAVVPGADEARRLRDSSRHEQVANALRRFDDGSYGTCAGCGEPIAFGRLLVMPEATRCVTCAARA